MMTSLRLLELSDRDVIEQWFRDAAYPLNEYRFATQFCWRTFNRTRWGIFQDRWLLIQYEEEGQERFLCPVGTGEIEEPVRACLRYLAERGADPTITFVPEPQALMLARAGLRVEADRDNADYIYARSDLADLAGRRLHRKRNLIRRFEAQYPWTLETVAHAHRRECLVFMDEWCEEQECASNVQLEYEVEAMRTWIRWMEHLPMLTCALRVDGRMIGLAVGEPHSDGVFVQHYEKALRAFDGATQMLCREFARRVPGGFDWINREQDAGSEGLRKAKESYFPTRLESAFRVRPYP